MTVQRSHHKLALAITASILAACGARAYDVPLTFLGTNMPPLVFHGFASQGLLSSSDYDYLGPTRTASAQFTEAGVNVSMDPFPHTHITAQGFLFDLGNVGQYDPVLDYALVDYSFNDAIGVRAGRIIRPEGIYNSIQSVDLARTSVLLPQGMYDARWRDFSAAIDGGSLYGDIGLSKAGDLSYEVYGGYVELSQNGGIARSLQGDYDIPHLLTFDQVNGFPEVGAQIWWNTPINGLRAGLAALYADDLTWDYFQSPLIGGGGDTTANINASVIHASLEYVWKSWTFQAEYRLQYLDGYNEANVHSYGDNYSASDSWYAGAAYRFNKWFEVGTYYTEYYANIYDRDGSGTATPADAYQKDVALSFRFDPKPWWVIKVEGHCMHGTALLDDNQDNPVRNEKPWYMLALKTTVSF
jgi:hypothetical protein